MLCYEFPVTRIPWVMLWPFRVGTIVQALQSLLIYSNSRIRGHGLTGVYLRWTRLSEGGFVFWTIDVGSFWIPAVSREELET
uniref:Uncharacterized protein n=1 Tax=Arundo donax TaxID=35708 RepID=A0A0A9EP03_ARUDO